MHRQIVRCIMEGEQSLHGLSNSQLVQLLVTIAGILSSRLTPATQDPPRQYPASPSDRSPPPGLSCSEECSFCGARCCRLEPGHRHHKCALHLRWR